MFKFLRSWIYCACLLLVGACASPPPAETISLLGRWEVKRLTYHEGGGFEFANDWWFTFKESEVIEQMGSNLTNHYQYSRDHQQIMLAASGIHQTWNIIALSADRLVIDTHFWIFHLGRDK